MGHHQHGLAPLLPDLQQLRPHVFTGQRVQRTKRLVQQQQVRVVDQCPRDGHPLRHAAGKILCPGVFKPLQAD